MEQGFGPRLSRVAAGLCFLLFLWALGYYFGPWVTLAIVTLPVLIALLLTIALPNSSHKKRIINLVARSVDVSGFFMERLDDGFENLERRLRR